MSSHTPLRLPDHMSRADIGAYMRELRLHYGLTEQDVSERLHIRVRYVVAIEQANLDAMPGRAYARGYVHTYAEFLGLDADQVVERCFGPELSREAQAHALPQSSQGRARTRQWWGALLVLGIVGLIGYMLFGQPEPDSDEIAVSTTVESVPENLLQKMRTHLMPTGRDYDCLVEETYLGCYAAQALTRLWVSPEPTAEMSTLEILDEDANDVPGDEEQIAPPEEVKKPVAVKPQPVKKKVRAGELPKKPAAENTPLPSPELVVDPAPEPEPSETMDEE